MGFAWQTPPDLTEPLAFSDRNVYVGALFLPAGTPYTRHYEVAAWHTTLMTTEDRWYPVFAQPDHIYPQTLSVTAVVDAEIVDEYTPALFGGVAYGSQPQGKKHRNVGRADTFRFSVTPQMVDEGTFIPVTLTIVSMQKFYNHSNPRLGEVYITSDREWRRYSEASWERLCSNPVRCVSCGSTVAEYGFTDGSCEDCAGQGEEV